MNVLLRQVKACLRIQLLEKAANWGTPPGRRRGAMPMHATCGDRGVHEREQYSQFCVQLEQEALLIVHWGGTTQTEMQRIR